MKSDESAVELLKMRKNKLRHIFKNRFGHFRAGWRLLICLGMVTLCFAPVAGLLKLWDLLSPHIGRSDGFEELASAVSIIFYLGLSLSFVLGSWLTLRWIDKRPYPLLGLDFDFGPEGSLMSIVISIFFIVFLVRSGWLKPDAFRSKLWRKYPAGFGLEPVDKDV